MKKRYIIPLAALILSPCLTVMGQDVVTDSLAEGVAYSRELDEVVVSGRSSVKRLEMGVERLEMDVIQRLPVLMGEVDVLKSIQLLPGVQSTSEGGSGFSVRGGAPDQNLILLDNTTVYNASHLLGFFSVFNNDVVSGLELYKGDLPLRYGGRLSSLLSVETKSDSPESLRGTGGVGLISGRLMLEGKAGEKTSWMVGGRRSYVDIFFGLSPEENIKDAVLHFYDLNAKVSHRLSDKDKLELSGYYGQDAFGAEMGRFSYGNTAASLLWRHSFSGALISRISLDMSRYRYHMGAAMDELQIDWGAGIADVSFKADFTHNLGSLWNLHYGISGIRHSLSPGDVAISGMGGMDGLHLLENNAWEHGIYLSNEQELTERLSLKYGLRLSAFQNVEKPATYLRPEPRLGAVYLLDEQSSLKANYTHNVQFLQLAENSSSGSPLNIWFAADSGIRPQTADMFAIGYFRNFDDNRYEASIETYYKSLHNVIDFAEHADLLLNEHLETEIRTGTGKAYGIEFAVRKNSGRLTGFANYTLSRSERTIAEVNQGQTYLSPYDKTHSINIALTYELSPKWSASTAWIFATGTPTTYPTGRFEIDGEYYPLYSGRNEYRKPNYHRLDLSLNYVPRPKSRKRWHGEWNFAVYNAYGRKNPWLITYNQTGGTTPTADMTYLFRFVPSITYNFKF